MFGGASSPAGIARTETTRFINVRNTIGLADHNSSAASTPSSDGEPPQHPFEGMARIVDGDTIALGDQRIRLFGIDAPEHDQICSMAGKAYRCGNEATAELTTLMQGRQPSCEPKDHDRYGRLVAVCFVDGKDIGQEMVESGWAVAFRKYSEDYVTDEAEARTAHRGLWQGVFQLPNEWRALHQGR